MNPAPDPSTKFYLAISGQAQGPHSAQAVLNLRHNNTIDDNTMICAEGGSAWVPLKELEPVLRAIAPPVQPAGYGGSRPAGTPPPAVQQIVILQSPNTTKGLRLGTLLGALILFFLPWVELKCAGQRLMYQSGIQTVLNQASMDGEMEAMTKMNGGNRGGNIDDFSGKELGGKIGHSFLTGAALVCVVIAFAVACGASGRKASGIMAAVALALLGVQAAVGFPLKLSFDKEMELRHHRNGTDPNEAEMRGPGGEMMSDIFAVKFSPWFYGELGLLAAATAMGLSGSGSRRR